MTSLPDWMRPPRAEGWFAEDLDRLPEAPRHTELIDGALVFMLSPRRTWHSRVVTALTNALTGQAPEGVEVEREMTIRLDSRNRPEPDLLVTTADFDGDRTWFAPEDVRLVIELDLTRLAPRPRARPPHDGETGPGGASDVEAECPACGGATSSAPGQVFCRRHAWARRSVAGALRTGRARDPLFVASRPGTEHQWALVDASS
ncbi:Uma2 family endonuclease [Kitasatospora sp. NPDC088134]|uniref:Uma2 family endonuclease n=1 Tax=Kitasatospora sp. NPDC088134 TaxID=3364071 RepID=UPI0038069629